MNLIKYNRRVLAEPRVKNRFSQQHPVRKIHNSRVLRLFVVKSDIVPHQIATLGPQFLSHSLGYSHCCDSSGLGDGDDFVFMEAWLINVLCYLCRFTTARRAADDQRLRRFQAFDDFGFLGSDGQIDLLNRVWDCLFMQDLLELLFPFFSFLLKHFNY